MYLIYDIETRLVAEITSSEPAVTETQSYAYSNEFKEGDEFEWGIWVDEVSEDNKITSFTAVRNNPHAKRLLKENNDLKMRTKATEDALLLIMMEGTM